MEPTSASTMKRSAAAAIRSRLAASSIGTVPSETSTQGNPQSAAQSRNSRSRPWAQEISSSVPPGEASTRCRASRSSLAASCGSR